MANRKAFRLEVKDVAEDGSFVGSASVYGNVDLVNEVVDAGAFKRSLDHQGPVRPLLWQHHNDEPIGTIEVTKDGPGALEVKGQLVLEVAKARECYALLKAGAIRGLSIGYRTVKDAWDGSVRHLKELNLMEVSVVTIPANPLAQVAAVKSARNREAIRSTIETLSALLEGEDESEGVSGEGSEDPAQAPKAASSAPGPGNPSGDTPADTAASQELLEDATALLLDMTLASVRA